MLVIDTGAGRSSSAESTAHHSNRDSKCECQETEVFSRQVGQHRAHQSNRQQISKPRRSRSNTKTSWAVVDRRRSAARTSTITRFAEDWFGVCIGLLRRRSVNVDHRDDERTHVHRLVRAFSRNVGREPATLSASVLDPNRRGKSGVTICSRQAVVCLGRLSRPRTHQAMTSSANHRKERSDEIKWAPSKRTRQTVTSNASWRERDGKIQMG